MIFEDKIKLAALETLLVVKFRPTFLALTLHEEDGTIEVVISCLRFNSMTVSERTISVFNEVFKELPHLIEEHLIVIQCFNGIELERVLSDMFDEELNQWM